MPTEVVAARILEVSFVVFGKSQPRGSKTVHVTKTGKRVYRDANPKSYPWMSDVAKAAAEAMGGRPLLEGPLRIDLDFYLARPQAHFGSGKNSGALKRSAPTRPITKPDVPKLSRGTVDAMKGIVFRDDSQQVEGDARKFYGEPVRCEVRVSTVKL